MKRLLLFFSFFAAVGIGQTVAQALEDNHKQTIKMAENSNWLSLTSPYILYFNFSYSGTEEPVNTKCFAFKAVAADNDCVYLKSVSLIPAGTPIWIWGVKGSDYTSIVQTLDDLDDLDDLRFSDPDIEFDEVSDNMLVGSVTESTLIESGDYFLSSQDDQVHSADLTEMVGHSLPAGKALLRTGNTSNAQLRFAFLDDEAEGIDAVRTKDGRLIMYDPQMPSYNAAGQLMPADVKGLHIQNGYKFYVR